MAGEFTRKWNDFFETNGKKLRNWGFGLVGAAIIGTCGYFAYDHFQDRLEQKDEVVNGYETITIPAKDSTINALMGSNDNLRTVIDSQDVVITNMAYDLLGLGNVISMQSDHIDSLKSWGVFNESDISSICLTAGAINEKLDSGHYKSQTAKHMLDTGDYEVGTEPVKTVSDKAYQTLTSQPGEGQKALEDIAAQDDAAPSRDEKTGGEPSKSYENARGKTAPAKESFESMKRLYNNVEDGKHYSGQEFDALKKAGGDTGGNYDNN
ncbi:MAG: hypothetical protein ACLFTH_00540 [Candidatus Woesearchaeota archaeon]